MVATRSGRRWLFVLMGTAISLAYHGVGRTGLPAAQAAGAAGSGGSFDPWKELGAWLRQFGTTGLVVLGVLALGGWLISQAGNLEKVWGWFRQKPERPADATPSADDADQTNTSDNQASICGEGSHNQAVAGERNQVASHLTAGRDLTVVFRSEVDAVTWNWPGPLNFMGYIQEKRKGFSGRVWLFEKVHAWFRNPHGSQALLIEADFGVGKSAFMAELCARQSTPEGLAIVAHHFCDPNTAATLEAGTFVRSVAAQLAVTLPAYRAAVEADPEAQRRLDQAPQDPAAAFSQAVIAPLHRLAAPKGPMLLLVDGLDETLSCISAQEDSAHGASIVDLLEGCPEQLPAWLRVLATSRRRQEVRQSLEAAYSCDYINAELTSNLTDIHSYVEQRCAVEPLAGRLVAGGRSSKALADQLADFRQSGGKFLYAVRVLNALANGRLTPDRLDALPPGMDAFYYDAFERRFPTDLAYAPMRELLGLMAFQREPLPVKTMAGILEMHGGDLEDLLSRIEDFLRIGKASARTQADEAEELLTYSLDHASLAQWLTEKNASGFPRANRPQGRNFAVDAEAARQMIAAWAKREAKCGTAHLWPYLTRHIAAHLDPDDRTAVFGALLFDLPWLEARLRWADLNALLSDFQWGEWPRLRIMERALRQGGHVVVEYPHQFLVQLLARWPETSNPPPDEARLRHQAIMRIFKAGGAQPLFATLVGPEALQRSLVGHLSRIRALAVLPDGRLASGSADCTIRLWDLATGVCTATFEGHSNSVTALAVLPDGRLASGSDDGTIRLWDPATGVCTTTFEGHRSSVRALAVLPDGRIASGSYGGTIHDASIRGGTILLWDPATGVCTATFEGHSNSVRALAVLPDGRVSSGNTDDTIWLWDPATGTRTATLEGHRDWVNALVVLPDGRLASGSEDQTIRLWDPATGACTAIFDGLREWVNALAVLPDGRLASGSDNGTVRLWDPATDACTAPFEGHRNWVNALTVLLDGRIASGSDDGTIRLWDPATGACTATFEGHRSWVRDLAVLPDGRLASGFVAGTIRLWDTATGACTATFEGPRVRGRQLTVVNALTVLPDGRLASGFDDGTIRLWDTATGTCTATFEHHSDWVRALVVLPDGRLASASDDRTIRLWDPATGACTATFEGHTGAVKDLAVLPDGRLASGSADCTIRLWDPASGVPRSNQLLFVAERPIYALAFLMNTPLLVAGDAGGRLHWLQFQRT